MYIGYSRTAVAVLVTSLLSVACAPSGTTTTSSTSPITFAALEPLTGRVALYGQAYVQAATAALNEINAHGGVMGRPLQLITGDTASDPVDAVTAFRQLQIEHPAFEVGPTAIELPAVLNLYDPAHLVDFTIGGETSLDHLTQKYVWRSGPSDSSLDPAMAYYAIQKGYKRCSMLYESGAGANDEQATLAKEFTAHGGTVTDVEFIVGAKSSYRSEVLKLYNSNPDCLFFYADIQTVGTLVSNIKELGFDHIPMVGDDNLAAIDIVKAAGLDFASKWITGVAGSRHNGVAYDHFLSAFSAAYPSTTCAVSACANVYDSIIIAALAMSAAHSVDPTVWVSYIDKVTGNESAPVVNDYQDGIAKLNAGSSIDYEGAAGPDDYNQYHNLFGAWDIVRYDTSGTQNVVMTVTADQVAAYTVP